MVNGSVTGSIAPPAAPEMSRQFRCAAQDHEAGQTGRWRSGQFGTPCQVVFLAVEVRFVFAEIAEPSAVDAMVHLRNVLEMHAAK